MKRALKFVLFECNRLNDNLWEVSVDYHWDNGTFTSKDITHHSTKIEAEEQNSINKQKIKL